jgi:Flp pilus assembly protein TadB
MILKESDTDSQPVRFKVLTSRLPGEIVRAGRDTSMFWAIFVILLLLWAIGLLCHFAFSHLALAVALIILIIRLFRSRAP